MMKIVIRNGGERMSVLIKGMKMPKSCDSCDLIQFDDEELEAHCPLSLYYRVVLRLCQKALRYYMNTEETE